jgi:hypothetical protein
MQSRIQKQTDKTQALQKQKAGIGRKFWGIVGDMRQQDIYHSSPTKYSTKWNPRRVTVRNIDWSTRNSQMYAGNPSGVGGQQSQTKVDQTRPNQGRPHQAKRILAQQRG